MAIEQKPVVNDNEPAQLGSPPRVGRVRERLALDGLDYPIAPTANRLAYMLGGLTFFGILILIVTGILLDQYYNPNPVAAHDSLLYIMTRVPLGYWIRGLHYWAASLVLVSVFLHMSFVFWRRSYLRPREVTWWAGVGLFMVLFFLAFTGTVLRADQEGGEALEHAIAGAKMTGPMGFPLSPDFTTSTSLLSRLHSAHVSLLPLVMLALIGLHFWLIRSIGINSSESKTSRFSEHLPKLTGYALLVFALAGLLAAFFLQESAIRRSRAWRRQNRSGRSSGSTLSKTRGACGEWSLLLSSFSVSCSSFRWSTGRGKDTHDMGC